MLLLLAFAFLLAATEPDLVGEFSLKGEDAQSQPGTGRCLFSPDDRYLAVEAGAIQVIDLTTKEVKPQERGQLLAWLPGGLCWRDTDGWILRGRERLMRLLPNGETALMTPEGELMAVSAAPTATADKHYHATLWSLTSGERKGGWDFTGPAWESRAATAKTVAWCTRGGLLKIWDLRGNQSLASAQAPETNSESALVFSKDNSLVILGMTGRESEETGSLSARNARSGEQVASITTVARGGSTALACAANGTLVAAGVGEKVMLWDIPGKKLKDPGFTLKGTVDWVAFSPSGGLLAATSRPKKNSSDRLVRIWRLPTTTTAQ